MGCDAHPYIELRNDNGDWELVDCEEFYRKALDSDDKNWYENYLASQPSYVRELGQRSYTLFAILADVRNYRTNITPLFPRRGMPADISPEAAKHLNDDDDLHSHTFFTLRELLETDWDALSHHEEIAIFADQFKAYKDGKFDPTEEPSFRVDAPTEFHRQISEDEMALLLMTHPPKRLTKKVTKSWGVYRSGPHIIASVPITYRQAVPTFIKCLDDLAEVGAPDDVRILIAYDN